MRTTFLRSALLLTFIAPLAGAQWPTPTPPTPPTPPHPPEPPTPAVAPLPPLPPDAPRLYRLDSGFDVVGLSYDLDVQPTMLRSSERYPQDEADSTYREARTLLNRGEWRRAATLFAQVAGRTPASAYAPDALYWQAFALYRIGGMTELRDALTALDARKSRFPRARNNEEADALAVRVGGALAARGDATAQSRVRGMASGAETVCDSEELSVRSSALSVLMRNDPEAAIPILNRVLDRKDECSVSLRKSAVMMIGTKGDAAAKAKLADVAKSDPSADVRGDAIGYLAKVSGDEIVASLESVIRSDEDEGVQRAAVRALGAHESPRARAAIRALVERTAAPERLRLEALSTFDRGAGSGFNYNYAYSCSGNDCTPVPTRVIGGLGVIAPTPSTPIAPTPAAASRPAVRAEAPLRPGLATTISSSEMATIDALRWSNSDNERRISPEDATWLRGAYPRLETTRLKSRAVAVLSRSSDDQTLIWLMNLVQKEEEPADVRATVLSRLGKELPIAQLNRLYDGASSRAVRSQIVEVLGDRKEPEATDKLIEIVRTGTDPQLRRSAISALNGKKDPRTTKLLLELIDR